MKSKNLNIPFMLLLLVPLLAINGSAQQYPKGSGVITVGNRSHYINYSPAQRQQQQDGQYIIRLGPGSYNGKATANVTLKIDSQGNQTVQFLSIDKSRPVLIGGIIDDPTDPGDPDPPPTNGDTVAKAKAAVAQIDDMDTAVQMVAAYSAVVLSADQFSSPQQVAAKVRQIEDEVLSSNNATVRWAPWKEFYSAEFTKLDQEQNIDTVVEYVAVLADMRDGMLQAVQDSNRALDLNLTDIFTIVQTVLAIIQDIQEGDLDILQVIDLVKSIIEIFRANGMALGGVQ